MESFRKHTGLVAPLDAANVDTDQIIPKQFLKRIERTGYGEFLFYDWRYGAEGKPNPEFVLNNPRYQAATVLVANRNFGCGSSREHAVWALHDYGFRAVIAPSFADIFTSNCAKNGLLALTLSDSQVKEIIRRSVDFKDYRLTINLEENRMNDEYGLDEPFIIDASRRHRYLNGLDDIGLTLESLPLIDEFETRRRHGLPTTTKA
ncbi:MAG TPA: 3-isopropylmalate dehydratase small subunit [Candidatus Acidoferrales bacterium]|nr:3-isopropylmalate dehydratase small subunit [Candidatus Acidoferrales bacterium]